MTLDSATGAIYGAPADTTMTTATISLVVDGYSGSLTTVFNQLIQKPGLTLVDAENAGIFRIQVAAPLPSGAHVALSDPRDYGVLSVAQGVAVAYSLLPQREVAPGVTFDTQTGSLTGTPSTPGTYSMLVGATVSYEGRSDTTGKSITLVVEDPAVRLSYTPSISGGYDMCVSSPAVPFASIPPGGYPVRFVPSFQGTLPGDMFSDFQATSNYAASAPLQTLSLDPITGVISGNAFAPNNYCKAGFMDFTVSFTLTRGAFTKRLTQNFWFSN
jgi:hypothetical protein